MIFLHKIHQEDLILMDTGDELKSEENLQDSHLINNGVIIIKIDWRDTSFPHEMLDDSPPVRR